MGLEPTTFGITIRRSNRLSYNLQFKTLRRRRDSNPGYPLRYGSFQDCCNQPLYHTSVYISNLQCLCHCGCKGINYFETLKYLFKKKLIFFKVKSKSFLFKSKRTAYFCTLIILFYTQNRGLNLFSPFKYLFLFLNQ